MRPEDCVAEAVTGRESLTQEQIDLINRVKGCYQATVDLVGLLEQIPHVDRKWLAIGEASIGQGFMALVRAISEAAHPAT